MRKDLLSWSLVGRSWVRILLPTRGCISASILLKSHLAQVSKNWISFAIYHYSVEAFFTSSTFVDINFFGGKIWKRPPSVQSRPDIRSRLSARIFSKRNFGGSENKPKQNRKKRPRWQFLRAGLPFRETAQAWAGTSLRSRFFFWAWLKPDLLEVPYQAIGWSTRLFFGDEPMVKPDAGLFELFKVSAFSGLFFGHSFVFCKKWSNAG